MRASLRSGLPQLNSARLARGVAAGLAWGTAVAGGLLMLTLYSCGGLCLADIVETTSLSMLAGLVAIGPLAAFGRRG
ncbi:hypothetical protein [Pseudorhodoplanes sp.]|uniref:hypothetical protein n=1 Tax=Pseudorhodoplanes sp. TaxID=1934341 RepID=UPI002CF6CC08|nr:hypothetical protein [Pseudorhodoplanes sp.]HWV41984.1 hypothetical protein [Pseudorhodoplanes sp.]